MNLKTVEMIRHSQLGCGLSQESIEEVASAATWNEYKSGETIFQQDQPGNEVLLIADGRVKITVSRPHESEVFMDHLGTGEHFGEMAILTGQPRAVTATAVMDSRLLVFHKDRFQTLMNEIPGLAANISRAMGFRLRRETTGKKIRSVSRVIGIVNPSVDPISVRMSERMVAKLAAALSKEGERVRFLSNMVTPWSTTKQFDAGEIPRNMNPRAKADWVKGQLAEQSSHDGHTLVYLTGEDPVQLKNLLVQCDKVLWLSTPNYERANKKRLKNVVDGEPRLASATHWCWMLHSGFNPEDIPQSPAGLSLPDFKIVVGNSGESTSRLERMSISRLGRFIRKTRLGLALGGGAAKGLAHLGVLKAFEAEGIYFDVISGTSAGALMAVPYAYGWSPDECTEAFLKDLTPGWFFRHLPRGNDWYMLYQFRMGKWDGLLRKHIGDVRLEQLLTPVSTVAADLITGRQVIRDRGDAISAILESINLPSISKPIFRDGMALVDGGILNNVPADVLPERGADLVVGADISSQIALNFGGNTQQTPAGGMRNPGQLRTIMRANEVRDHQITELRTQSVDHMIKVDTSGFDFADFTNARELSRIGEEAAYRSMDSIKELLKQQKESGFAASERFVCGSCNEQDA